LGHAICYPVITGKGKTFARTTGDEVENMFIPRGYYTAQGYTGYLPDGSRMAFPTHVETVCLLTHKG
jgi:hypothetical protein